MKNNNKKTDGVMLTRLKINGNLTLVSTVSTLITQNGTLVHKRRTSVL